MSRMSSRPEVADSVVLFCINLFSALPYLSSLGFYSDDWEYQAVLARFSSQGIATMIRELLRSDPGMLVRPVQVAYLVLSFKAFGRHATPYHIVNSAVLGLTTILLYLALRELRMGRWLAFAIALVFGLLPHYSTDRFWISSHQATLCMAFALLGIYALARCARPEEPHSIRWVVFAVLALVLSILSYEVALGMIVASMAIVAWRIQRDSRASSKRIIANLGGIAGTAAVLLLVGIIKIRTQTRMAYHHHLLKFLSRTGGLSWRAIVQAVKFDFWTYGLHMPVVLARLYWHSSLSRTAVVSAIVVALFSTAYLWRNMEPSAIPSRRGCLWLVLMGFVLFGLGFALFSIDPGTDFSSAGLDNRVEIASALGAAFVLVGVAGLASSLLNFCALRERAFSLAIGLICGVNCLVVSGIGFFWTDAASRQSEILRMVTANVRSLPPESVLLLDGFCRYSGPGVVFETDWDSTGAIQLALGSYSLKSDVVSPSMLLHDRTVETMIYGEHEGGYSYGDHLFVFNVKRQTLASWPSREAATAYLRAENPDGNSGCPQAREGDGAKVF